MSIFPGRKPFDQSEEPKYHYDFSLSQGEWLALVALVKHDRRPTIAARQVLAQRIEMAKKHEGPPLPDASLPFAEIEAEAKRQGCDVADIIWDRGRMPG